MKRNLYVFTKKFKKILYNLVDLLPDGFSYETNMVLRPLVLLIVVSTIAVGFYNISTSFDVKFFTRRNYDFKINSELEAREILLNDELAQEAANKAYANVKSDIDYSEVSTENRLIIILNHKLYDTYVEDLIESNKERMLNKETTVGYALYIEEITEAECSCIIFEFK